MAAGAATDRTMLRLLKISNLAIVDEIEVEFKEGFNVLTGETGAGKSILIGALDLALGGRIPTDVVRTGEAEARIETLFEIPPGIPLPEAVDLDSSSGGELVLARRISDTGKSKCFINGNLVAPSLLKQVGWTLVSIFGQHEHHVLMNPEEHLEIVDRFGALWDRRLEVGRAYADWKNAEKQLGALKQTLESLKEQAQERSAVIKELADAQIKVHEDETLAKEKEKLSKAVQIREKSYEAYHSLYGRSGSILAELSEIRKMLDYLASADPDLAPLRESLSDAIYRIEDVAFELRSTAENATSDPHRLELIEERLNLLRRLQKKHKRDLAGLLELKDALEQESEHIENVAAEVKKAEKALELARQSYFDLASRLSAARKDTAEALSRAVEKELSELAMPHAKFKVSFKAAETAKPSAVGVDSAEFHLSANPGEQFRPLARIASGGELSRIMLALKALEVDRKGAPTVIFDEVDAGIGGFTALAVGTRLARVAKKQQVLCVTHLHQIAALADHHISVKKSLHKGRTALAAAALDHQGRIDELARMIGASPDSPDVRSHILALMKRPQ